MIGKVRPVEAKDCPLLWKWRNAAHIRNCMIRDDYIEYQHHVEWFNRMLGDTQRLYLIYECDAKTLGLTYFTDINLIDRRCTWGFYVGEADAPKGSGLQMGMLALDYIFAQYELNKICSEVLVDNIISQRFHERLGFIIEGKLCEHYWRNGGFADVYVYGLLKDSWEKRKL